jgi:hypothetical protein
MVKRGSRIVKKYGYIFLEYEPTAGLLIDKFDKLEEKKIYVFGYNYRFKTFNAIVQKLTPNTLKIHLLHHYVYMTKENNGFAISIPQIFEKWRKEISNFFIYILEVHYNKIIYKWDYPIRIREKAPFRIEVKVPITGERTPEKVTKYGIEIGSDYRGNKFMITKINNTNIMKIKKRIEKKKNEPDIYYRKMMKTRTVMYQFIKTFRNKGILQMPTEMPPVPIYSGLRINNETIRDHVFHFSFPYELKNNLVHFNGVETILVDYDYDQVNQILFKFQLKIMPGIERTVLCGIDPNNRLWCNVLRGFMKWWRIENVYKNMYELDEKTQIYEF